MLIFLLAALALGQTCPTITCKELQDVNDQVDEDTLCYVHDHVHPASTIKTYPCPDGEVCEITSFDETFSFVTASTQASAARLTSQAFKRKASAKCVVTGDLMRNLTAGQACLYPH